MSAKYINGRLAPGHTANPNGRPPRAREVAYLLVMKEVADAKQWRALCHEAVMGARGKKAIIGPNNEPQVIDDPDSTPQSRLAYLRFLADYLIGKPIQPVVVDQADGEVLDEYLQLKEEELDVIIDVAKERSNSILRQARKIANRGVAKKAGRKNRSGPNGDSSETKNKNGVASNSE